MRVQSHLNVIDRLGSVPEGQYGYFTRAQAAAHQIRDFELSRSVAYRHIIRLRHGVYRVAGAGTDPHQELRTAWLRLQPSIPPRQRTHRPTLWVSHRSAAAVLGLGVFLSDNPEFLSTRRLQARFEARVRVRQKGLTPFEWTVQNGFAVTTPARTLADLVQAGHDGGHLGRFAADAIATGTDPTDLATALGSRGSLHTLLELAGKP